MCPTVRAAAAGAPPHVGAMWDIGVAALHEGGGVTVLLTTQYMEEADQLADDISVIDHGKVIATGTPDELKATTGGQNVDVRPVDLDQLDLVAELTAELTGQTPHRDEQTGLVTAPVTDPAILPALVRRLDDKGVTLAELSLRRPSLDEVFLTLTGHPAEQENAPKITEGSAV